MHPLILTIGTPGLAKSDLSLRAYRNGVSDTSGIISNCVIVDQLNGDYQVGGLSDAAYNEVVEITGEYPTGVGFFASCGMQDAMSNFVIPFREDGLTISTDYNVSLYISGVLQVVTFVAQALGSPADYRISGWTSNIAGDYLLVWRRNGFTFWHKWNVSLVASLAMNDAIAESAIISRFLAFWSYRTPVELIGDSSFIKPKDRPYVRVSVIPLSASEFSIGPRGFGRTDGVAHFDIFVPKSRPGGRSSGMQLAEDIKGEHRRVRLSSILFTTPETRTQGMDDEVYYGIKVYCPYRYIA